MSNFMKQKITPCLWFDDNVQEAVNFYVSVFQNSKIVTTTHYNDAMPSKKGQVMTITFQLEGQEFVALNGGPHFKFSEAVSLFVSCDTQEEVDILWAKLTADGGAESQCGWLKDKYGFSWQITPTVVLEMMTDPDTTKVARMQQALFTMKKLDLAALKKAFGKP